MLYRLAGHLGKTVAELDSQLTHEEWVGWLAFYGLEPFGCLVEDRRVELQLQVAAQVAGNEVKKPFITRDRQPEKRKAQRQTAKQQDDYLRAFFMLKGTRVVTAPAAKPPAK